MSVHLLVGTEIQPVNLDASAVPDFQVRLAVFTDREDGAGPERQSIQASITSDSAAICDPQIAALGYPADANVDCAGG